MLATWIGTAAAIASTAHAVDVTLNEYRAGKTNVMGFLVGAVMKASGGKVDPQLVNAVMKQKLES